jgi:uncharacterized protein (TIGR02996 family)
MSDEDALLAAIAAHPEEDTPRLAYADWLDEHGRHARADFIRLQVEVAGVEKLGRSRQGEYIDLYRRQHEFIEVPRADVLGPLAGLPDDARFEFERGFVSEVVLPFDTLYTHRRQFEAARPLPRVIVRDVTANVRRMIGMHGPEEYPEPYSHLVAAIETVPDPTRRRPDAVKDAEVRPADFRPLAWPRLTHLDLSGCHLGDSNTRTLLRTASLPALVDIDLSANYLTDAAVTALLDSGLPRQLKRVILGGNLISDLGAFELARRWPPDDASQLQKLNLRFTIIGTPGRGAVLDRFAGRVDLF